MSLESEIMEIRCLRKESSNKWIVWFIINWIPYWIFIHYTSLIAKLLQYIHYPAFGLCQIWIFYQKRLSSERISSFNRNFWSFTCSIVQQSYLYHFNCTELNCSVYLKLAPSLSFHLQGKGVCFNQTIKFLLK